MSTQEYSVNGSSGKPSVKDKISRRFRLTVAKTGQKLRHGQKNSDQAEFASIAKYHSQIKAQRVSVRELSEFWKKLIPKSEEISKLTSEIEDVFLRSFKANDEIRSGIEKSLSTFPTHTNPPVAAVLNDLKGPLDIASKKIKAADARFQNYTASKNVYEKAPEARREQERQAMETARAKLQSDVSALDEEMPGRITENDEKLYGCMSEYFEQKVKYLEDLLAETRTLQERIKQARAQYTSSPISHGSPLSPGSYAEAPILSPSTEQNEYSVPLEAPKASGSLHKDSAPTASSSSSSSRSIPAGVKGTEGSFTLKEKVAVKTTEPQATQLDDTSRSDDSDTSVSTPTNSEPKKEKIAEKKKSNGTKPEPLYANSSNDLTARAPPFDVIATYPYNSEEPDELQFKADEVVTVLPWRDADDEEPGWLYGKHKKTGNKGLFPANYVKLLGS